MKIKFVIVIFLSGASFFLLTECKKKKVGSEISGNQPFTPEYINGEFLNSKAYVVSGDSLIPSELRNFAIFTDSLVKDPNIKLEKSNDMGEVFLNEVKLVKSGDASTVFYEEASQKSTSNFLQKWTVTGNGNFKGFTFENYNDYPAFTGFKNLPDTLVDGEENVFKIEGYSADFIQITIKGGARGFSLSKKIVAPETTVTLTKEEVQKISNNGSIMNLQIEFYNDTYKIVSGKIFRFRTHTLFFKSNLIIY